MNTTEKSTLELKTVAELREMAKGYGIIGMSKKRKDIIIDAILAYLEVSDSESYETTTDATVEDTSRLPYVNAKLHSFLGADNTYQTLVSVSCGAASSNYPVVGRTVGFVKATYREILNIETDARAIVNGTEVDDSYVLKSADTLEFVRRAGTKG